MKIFTKDEILKAIYDKFDSMEELSIKLGTSKQNISAKLRRLSTKFLNQLKSVGIVLPYKTENNISTVNESVVIYQANRIMELEKEIEKLKLENVKLRVQSVPLNKNNKGAKIK